MPDEGGNGFYPKSEKNWLMGLEGLDQGGQEVRPDEQEFVDLGVISWGVGLSTLAKTLAQTCCWGGPWGLEKVTGMAE